MKFTRLMHVSILLISGCLVIQAQTDPIRKFSLAEAQLYAVENFYLSKNAGLDIQAARWKVWETTAIGLPQVSASASYQHIPGEIPTFDFGSQMGEAFEPIYSSLISNGLLDPADLPEAGEPSAIAVRNSVTYGVTVSQLIFSGEYIVGLQASRVYKSLSEEADRKTTIELKQGVADAYFGMLLLKKNRVILEKTLQNLETNLVQIRKSFEVGLVEDTEVDQIDLVVKRTRNELSSLDRQIQMMNYLFKYQIGLEPGYEVELTDNIDDLIVLNIVNDEAYSFILDDNIDFKLLSTQEKLMKLNMNRQKSAYLPTLAGFYQYQDKTEKADFDFTINHILGVSLDFPIVTSGSRMAKISQARIEYEKAVNIREQESNRLVMAARQARYDYRTALDKYNNEKLNFELSEKVYNKTTEKYKEGFVSSLELSLINNQFLQAQLTYSLAVQELLSAKLKMDKAYNRI